MEDHTCSLRSGWRERALGGMAWDDGTTRAALLTRNFWQQGPKSIRIVPDGAQLLLLDAEDKPLEIGKTRAKSHDLLLCLSPATGQARSLLALAKLWQTPLLPVVDPAYLCQSEALTVISPVDKDFFPAFEAAVENTMGRWMEEIDRDVNYLGLMNYGDGPLPPGAYGHKGVAYVDQEYDTSHALLQLFARSGDRRFFDLAEAAARHFMDVDVDQLAGWNRFHGYRDTCETHKAVTTRLEWGHVHLDGLVDFYYLTGDRRALEIAKGIGNCCLPLGQGPDHGRRRSLFKGCERSLGWPLLSLMRIYEATLEKKYLEAADNIVAYVNLYARSPQDEFQRGTWWRTWMADGCKPFMCGILHEGLGKHHELTGAPETEASILKGLDWLIDRFSKDSRTWHSARDGYVYAE